MCIKNFDCNAFGAILKISGSPCLIDLPNIAINTLMERSGLLNRVMKEDRSEPPTAPKVLKNKGMVL